MCQPKSENLSVEKTSISWTNNVNISDTDTMVNIHLACPYEKRILPFLQKPLAPHEELRLMGQDGEFVSVHPQLASPLLNPMLETSSVIAPEAPIAAMQELSPETPAVSLPISLLWLSTKVSISQIVRLQNSYLFQVNWF